MNPFFATLLEEKLIVTDGAWGTQIQQLGLQPGSCPDVWNLDRPEAIERVARSYVDAGSRVILTNTFGASRIMLERHGLADKAVAINRAGAAISWKATAGRAYVFGSIGPSGKLLFTGEVGEGELSSAFEEQAMALAEGGAHAIVIETMSDLAEAKLALKAAKKTGLPVVVSMVYDSGKEYDRTMMGVAPSSAAQELKDAGADAIGANCGMGIEFFLPVCRQLRAASDLPIWIKPNAGLPEVTQGKVIYHTTPAQFAERAVEIRDAGAHFLGGCCGTSPEFIRALKETLRAGK